MDGKPLTGGGERQRDEVGQASRPFVGQWHRLISTTNWEKGRIINQWRDALVARNAPATDYSDDAWSRKVGNISSQHVGRLRRVFRRFAEVREDYEGLYWSHFHAALDWNDAEMWLEGAVRGDWSVAQMREQRWQALGAPDSLKPAEDEVYAASWDGDGAEASGTDSLSPSLADVQDPAQHERRAASDAAPRVDRTASESRTDAKEEVQERDDAVHGDSPGARPFADLPSLPQNLSEAMENLKLAILHHRIAGWQDTSPKDVVAYLDALRQLTEAPVNAA